MDNDIQGIMTVLFDEITKKEGWKIKNDDEAEWLIEKTNEELYEINRYEMALENKIAALKEKQEKVKKEKEFKIARRDGYLLEYFESIDDKLKKKTKTQEKYRLPSGEIVKKYPEPEYKRNDETLVNWCKSGGLREFYEVKESVKWGELKKLTEVVGNNLVMKGSGEVVEGIEVIERAPTLEFKEV